MPLLVALTVDMDSLVTEICTQNLNIKEMSEGLATKKSLDKKKKKRQQEKTVGQSSEAVILKGDETPPTVELVHRLDYASKTNVKIMKNLFQS